jgi:hypothetical protein
MTQPIRGLRAETPRQLYRAHRRLSSVHIPAVEKPLGCSVRATPPIIVPDRHVQKKQTNSPVAIFAEGSGDTRQPSEASATETRTPGSSFILPANPLSDESDASLEGLVDCGLFESYGSADVPSRARLAQGPMDETADRSPAIVATVDDEPTQPMVMPLLIAAEVLARREKEVERMRTSLVVVETSDAATRRPDLSVGKPNIGAHAAGSARRWRTRRLLSVALASAMCAAFTIVAVFTTTPARSVVAAVEPAVTADAEAVAVRGTEQVEAPPPSTPDAPNTSKRPIHSVLIKTYPIAAAVMIGDRSYGTTPTYIKVPANTPVQVRIARVGFKPVTRVVKSKQRFDEVFVPLQRNRARKGARGGQRASAKKQAPKDLSDL